MIIKSCGTKVLLSGNIMEVFEFSPFLSIFQTQISGPMPEGGATDGWDKCLFWSSQESHCWPGGVIVSVWRRRLAALVSGTGNFNPRSYWICFINLTWIHKVSSIQITSKRVVSGFWCSFGSPILFLMYISKYHCMTIWAHLPRVWPPLGFLKADIQTNVSPPNLGTSPFRPHHQLRPHEHLMGNTK